MAAERFVVIGSNSFSGATFIAEVLRQGADVLGISRSAELDEVFLPYKWSANCGTGSFRFHRLDLNCDMDRIEAVIREFQPDYVVNFAVQGMVAQSWSAPEQWLATNTVAMVRLHDRLRKMSFLKKFVQASTPEVYGSTSGHIREDAPFNPTTPYAVSKTACDMSLLTFRKRYGFPVAFTRSANVCGPGQQPYRLMPRAVLCVLTRKKLRLEGGGKSVRSFIHISDVVDGTLRVARNGRPGEAYHLATETSQSVRDLVVEVCRQMNAKFEDVVEMAESRPGEDAAYLLDCTKARTELGWQPQRTVAQAISDTADWMRKGLGRLLKQPLEYVHKE